MSGKKPKKESTGKPAHEHEEKVEQPAGVKEEEISAESEKEPESADLETEPSAEEKLSAMQDKYLRLSAEFDNYRKRTLREKADILKTAGEEVLVQILPVMDDFDRAMDLIHDARDVTAVKTGVELIYQKFRDFLKIRGVKEIDSMHREFDTDFHEAVTKIPAPEAKLKGKVVDVVQKGYILHDRVIRYSKVVVGE